MSAKGNSVVVPEEVFSVAPTLEFGSCPVIRRPRGEDLEWTLSRSHEIRGLLALLTDRVTTEIMQMMPGLEVVANCAVGVDNVDIEGASKRGIWVTNTPGVLTEATADLTWALILAVVRRILEGGERIANREFTGWGLDFLLGYDLKAKVLGIIGPGRIGTAVALRGRAFGMEVVYFGREREHGFEETTGGRYLSLEDLLSTAQVISIHLPLDSSTERLIGEKELQRMRSDAILINTSRGGVVDEKALIRALKRSQLFGAGLDVFENEPLVPRELVSMPNVVVTPHIGSATRETRGRMATMAHENLMAVINKKEPPNPVNRPDKLV
jgi:glyoxylate reductase